MEHEILSTMGLGSVCVSLCVCRCVCVCMCVCDSSSDLRDAA
jgi:hypothetical protein